MFQRIHPRLHDSWATIFQWGTLKHYSLLVKVPYLLFYDIFLWNFCQLRSFSTSRISPCLFDEILDENRSCEIKRIDPVLVPLNFWTLKEWMSESKSSIHMQILGIASSIEKMPHLIRLPILALPFFSLWIFFFFFSLSRWARTMKKFCHSMQPHPLVILH